MSCRSALAGPLAIPVQMVSLANQIVQFTLARSFAAMPNKRHTSPHGPFRRTGPSKVFPTCYIIRKGKPEALLVDDFDFECDRGPQSMLDSIRAKLPD